MTRKPEVMSSAGCEPSAAGSWSSPVSSSCACGNEPRLWRVVAVPAGSPPGCRARRRQRDDPAMMAPSSGRKTMA